MVEEPWDFELGSQLMDYLSSLGSEFLQDWGQNDMRVAIFKLLLGWLLLSLLAIHLAWRVYGSTVNNMYYRQVIPIGIKMVLFYTHSALVRSQLLPPSWHKCAGETRAQIVRGMGGQNGGTPDYTTNYPICLCTITSTTEPNASYTEQESSRYDLFPQEGKFKHGELKKASRMNSC